MVLTLGPILRDAGIDLSDTLVIRHAYVREHGDTGFPGIHADSTDAEILAYTRNQSVSPRHFPGVPARFWIVFTREGGEQARLWKVLENRGEVSNDGHRRVFDVVESELLNDLRRRLVIGWRSPRTWWLKGRTAETYPVIGIADAEPEPFPGFDRLVLSHAHLQAVVREPRYASWRTALSAVLGIYLIVDTRDGRQYIGKAAGAESISQRWTAYATNGHGGNVELKSLEPSTFRYSLLRVFDPSTPGSEIDDAESHFKIALGSRAHGLNRN